MTETSTSFVRPEPSLRWRSFVERHWPELLLLVFCVFVAGARAAVLARGGAPATIDAGNWLAFGRGLLGEPVRSQSIVYPPVVPLLTFLFVGAFGPTLGVAVLGALCSLAPGVGMAAALRPLGYHWSRALVAALLIGAGATGEAAAWGGFPQLLGLGLLPVAWVALDQFLRTSRRIDGFKLGLLIVCVLATSHLVGVFLVASGVVMVAAHLLTREEARRHLGVVLRCVPLVVGPSVVLIPFYVPLLGGIGGNATDSANSSSLFSAIEFLYRDFPAPWRVAVILTLLCPVLLIDRRRSPAWHLVTAGLGGLGVLGIVVGDHRVLYLASPVIGIALVQWIHEFDRLGSRETLDRLRLSRPDARRLTRRFSALGRGLTVALGIVVVMQTVVGLRLFERQRDFYGVLTPGLYDGLIWIRDMTPNSSRIAVTSVRDAPLGWWVEGLTLRRTFGGSELRWLYFEDERRRAAVANALFASPFPNARTRELAELDDIDYLVVPTRWADFDPQRMAEFRERSPRSMSFENDDVVILDLAA